MTTLVRVCYTATLLGLAAYAAQALVLIVLYLIHRRDASPALPAIPEAHLPIVTVQIPLRNERHVARQVIEVLEAPGDFAHLGQAARAHMIERYDFTTRCLPEHVARINSLLPNTRALPLPG